MKLIVLFWLIAGLSACALCTKPSGQAVLSSRLSDRDTLVKVFKQKNITDPLRALAHLSHVCTLQVNGKQLAIVDLRELVRSPTVSRGVNSIIVLSADMSVLNRIEYTQSRPLTCKGNQLLVWGDLTIPEFNSPGNLLTFDVNGKVNQLTAVENNEWF
jgi:hypothetical protein